jgi:hypothetical protein
MVKGVDANFYSNELPSKRGPKKKILTAEQEARRAAAYKDRKAANQRAFEARRLQDPSAVLNRAKQKQLIFAKRWGDRRMLFGANAQGKTQLEQLAGPAHADCAKLDGCITEWDLIGKTLLAMTTLMLQHNPLIKKAARNLRQLQHDICEQFDPKTRVWKACNADSEAQLSNLHPLSGCRIGDVTRELEKMKLAKKSALAARQMAALKFNVTKARGTMLMAKQDAANSLATWLQPVVNDSEKEISKSLQALAD